jgi:orotidine-5'-phosphate decarboxylase
LQSASERLILALDTSSLEEARAIVDELHDSVGIFKVGLQLLSHHGPSFIDDLVSQGLKVFCDGKFHDIPNTVEQACAGIAGHGATMLTVMTTGGRRMLEGAVRGCRQGSEQTGHALPIVLGVTVLTSLSQTTLIDEVKVDLPMEEYVIHLANLARDSGVTGIVASAEEVARLREALGKEVVLVTPGVRPSWAAADDQARIVTPADAIKRGADYIVVGRPILSAADRKSAASRIVEEMECASAPT